MKARKFILYLIVFIVILIFCPMSNETSVLANNKLQSPYNIWVEKQGDMLMICWLPVENNNGYTISINEIDYKIEMSEVSFNATDIICEAKTYNIKIKTNGKSEFEDSEFSNVFEYKNKITLNTPCSLAIDENKVLSWQGDDRAKDYTVVINGIKIASNIYETEIKLDDTLANCCEYNITICANGDLDRYLDSKFSATLCYVNKIKLNAPIALSVATLDNNLILNWPNVSYAKNYEVFIDEDSYIIESNKFDILEHVKEVKDYNIKVRALDNNNFIASDFIEIKHKTTAQMQTPSINVKGETISWNKVENAISYTITINNDLYINTEYVHLSFDFSNYCTKAGQYILRVSANTNGNYRASDIVEYTYYKMQKLNSPTLSIENGILSWISVDNAKNYSVFIDGVMKDELITNNWFDLLSYCVEAKDYIIEVSANANGFYTASDKVDITYKHFVKLSKTTISINDQIIEWLPVLGAKSYTILIDDSIVESNCILTSFDFKNHITTAKLYKVGVFANGYDNFLDGEISYIDVDGKENQNSKTYQVNCHCLPLNLSDYIIYIDGEKSDLKFNNNNQITISAKASILDIVVDANTIQVEKEVYYFESVELAKAKVDNEIYKININCIQLYANSSEPNERYQVDTAQYFNYDGQQYSYHYIGQYAYYPGEIY